MMLYSARAGSVYSKNFLLSLYKVYYKIEYNRVKRLSSLTYLDILEMHDEDCYRKGLSSGHTVDGKKTFKEMTIERRRHEPGWTNVYKGQDIPPIPDRYKDSDLEAAAAQIRDIGEAPDEPPLQPVASRLLVMCGLMGITKSQST